ncbi:MAG: UbiA family prenyltransferase [Pseudomonadota bacterium]
MTEQTPAGARLLGVALPMTLSTALTLGRISNLPTVWTNALAAAALSGAAFGTVGVIVALLALSLSYVGGMWLNDAFDAEIDAAERADRPIPTGRARRGDVFVGGFAMLGLGWALVWPFGLEAALAGAALALAILAYDYLHKKTVLSPVLMGACRLGAYWVAGAALGSAGMSEPAWWGAFGLFAYVIGLTYAAKQEAYDRLEALWPLGVLAIPLLLALWFALGSWIGLLLWLVFAIWTAKCVELLTTRGPGDVPRAVVSLIAGIALYDAVLIAGAGLPALALLAALGFVATLALQRVAAGT